MITEEQITEILKSKQTVNEYYPCVTFYEYEEVAKEILKLVNSSNDIQNVSETNKVPKVIFDNDEPEHRGLCG